MKTALPDYRRHAAAVLACLVMLAAPCAAFADTLSDFFRAVKNDNYTVVKSLLERGLSPNLVEETRGDSGLILALREDSKRVFDILINTPGIDLEIRARNGDSALMIASYKGNVAAVKALLAKEAQVNNQGWTALHYAAAIGNDEIVRMLLEESAYIDAESPNSTTPLMMAAGSGRVTTVKLLLDEGADPTLKNNVGMTALDFAQEARQTYVLDDITNLLNKPAKP
ncbi:ankyrin repeat domain-containing protein [Oxalobacteraceae bacterium CAVE-383]|nr:ankyrin repeat domain-containing protein [Oxalobacteraceae bacterium CAVE-383]